jgi:hypothetical protein
MKIPGKCNWALLPAHIDNDPDPSLGGPPPQNAWSAGGYKEHIYVWAARSGIAINYTRPCRPAYNVDHGAFVKVPGAGPVTITDAPEGREAALHANQAELQFTSENGISGTLHLKDQTVTLDG